LSGPVTFVVFGLGEAGSRIAADLAAAGAEVRGFDPADVVTPPGVIRHDDPAGAVPGATVVMAVTAAADAQKALAQAWERIARGTIYADLSTAPPSLKEDLHDTASLRGLRFVDVALMATVPGRGLATPAYASGPGAELFAGIVNPLGAKVEVLGPEPGQAATRKLLRSVLMKGIASLLVEAMEAAEAAGELDWYWDHIAQIVTEADEDLLMRLVRGTETHATRRRQEMEATAQMLEILEVEPTMTRATAEVLRRVERAGLPDYMPGR